MSSSEDEKNSLYFTKIELIKTSKILTIDLKMEISFSNDNLLAKNLALSIVYNFFHRNSVSHSMCYQFIQKFDN